MLPSDERAIADRIQEFCDHGHVRRYEPDLDLTPPEATARRDTLTAMLIESIDGEPLDPASFGMLPGWTAAEIEIERQASEIILEEPGYKSPYDRLIAERVALENQAARAPEDRVIARKLQDVQQRLAVELERSVDDQWRGRRQVDQYRAEEGREAFNAARRTTRSEPNVMTPRDVLASETDEEKRQRVNAQKAASKAKKRAAETDEEREERKRRDRERKARKRQ